MNKNNKKAEQKSEIALREDELEKLRNLNPNSKAIHDEMVKDTFFDVIIPVCLRRKIPEEKRGSFFIHVKALVENKWDGKIDELEKLIEEESEIAVREFENDKLSLHDVEDGAVDEYLYEVSKEYAGRDAASALEFAGFALRLAEVKGQKVERIGEQMMELSCLKDNLRRINRGGHSFHDFEQIKFLWGSRNAEKIKEKLNEYRKEIISELEAQIKFRDEEIEEWKRKNVQGNQGECEKQRPIEKITWNSTKGKGLIYQLFEELIEKGFIIENKKGERASMIEKHFQDEKGKSIKAHSLISMKSARAGNKPKRGNEEITAITTSLEKPPKKPN